MGSSLQRPGAARILPPSLESRLIRPTTCPLDCPDACGVLAEVDERGELVRITGNPAHGYSRGTLCSKTAIYHELVHSPDRLRRPLVASRPGDFREASWEEALDLVAARLQGVPGERILGLQYGGNMGLVARKYPLRVLHALGATLHDGGICDTTAEAGYRCVLGDCVGPDLDEAEARDAAVLWGADVARTVQHLQPALQRMARRGDPVVAVDVYRTDTIRALERWGGRGIVLRPGTDAALALALVRLAFEEGRVDRARLSRECVGADELEASLRDAPDLPAAAVITGVAEERMRWLLDVLTVARRPLVKTGIGWTRRRNGGASMRAVCTLAAVLGHADAVHFESADHFGLAEDVVERPDLRPPGVPRPVAHHVRTGRDLEAGRYSAVLVWGHNPAVTLPDSRSVRRGLAREDVLVVVHEQFLTETAQLADVVLPAATFLEQTDVYRSYGHRWLQLGFRAVAPPGEARGNVAAFAALARRVGLSREVWDVDDEGLALALVDASRARIGEAGLDRLLRGEPVKLAPRAREGRGTPSGKVELASDAAEALGLPRVARHAADDACGDDGPFWLVSAPSRATHNTTYAHSGRHLARRGPHRAHLSVADALALGIEEGEQVTLENARGSLTLPALPSKDVPRGVIVVHGLPRASDVPEGVGVNGLASSELADMGNGNVHYSTRVRVRPAAYSDLRNRSGSVSGSTAAR